MLLKSSKFYKIIKQAKTETKNTIQPTARLSATSAHTQAISVGLKVERKFKQAIKLLILFVFVCLFSFIVKNNSQKPPTKLLNVLRWQRGSRDMGH